MRLSPIRPCILATGLLLCLSGFNAWSAAEILVGKGKFASCVGIDGIALGTSGICDEIHVSSDNQNALDRVAAISLSGDAEFSIGTTGTCKVGNMAPGTTGCTVDVLFTPASAGTKTATLSVTTTYIYAGVSDTTHLSMVINGQALSTVASCTEARAVPCVRSDGVTVPGSFCAGAAPASSSACASGSCTACTTGLSPTRFIDFNWFCTSQHVAGGCRDFPIWGITDALGNSCGSCTPRTVAKEPCPTTIAACGGSYIAGGKSCMFYNGDGTSSPTFNPALSIGASCRYTLTSPKGVQCSACIATWETVYGPNNVPSNPVGTATTYTDCPFAPY